MNEGAMNEDVMNEKTGVTGPVPTPEVFLEASMSKRLWPRVIIVALGVIALGGGAFFFAKKDEEAVRYTTVPLTRGDIVETIETTGTVEPLLQVQVGSQVSGRVMAVHVDFNDVVKKDQILAEIEPGPFEARVNQAKASVASARAQLLRAQADLRTQQKNYERAKALSDKGLNARADLDAAEGARDAAAAQVEVARAQVEQARASLASAEEDLRYTRIVAPIDGTVISRTIDPGQTVAASFQAPELFLIANDLTTMRVIAQVDEADVGKVNEGGPAEVRVDAFPKERFQGVVQELRVQPTANQGVVTYPAVIDVPNPDKKLRPGMTATVTLVAHEKKGALRVPKAALRYRPSGLASAKGPGAGGAGAGGQPRGASAGGPSSGAPRPAGAARSKKAGPTLWVLRDGRPAPVSIETGISDESYTEVIAPTLKEGDEIILDESGAAAAGGQGGRRRGPRIF